MVSAVGLGTNNFGTRRDRRETREVVEAALDAGITLIDTADIYGGGGDSESFIGDAIKGRRDEVVLATKFGGDMHGKNGPDWGARGCLAAKPAVGSVIAGATTPEQARANAEAGEWIPSEEDISALDAILAAT